MRWSWRRRRDEPPPPPTDAELADQVEEGLLIVMTGLRLSARNRVIIDALRDRAAFDEEALVAEVREDARGIIDEQHAAVARIHSIRDRAARRRGQAQHSADYRHGDVAPLERRARIAALLATRVEERIADDGAVRDLVRTARRSAMDDMFDAALHSLHASPTADDPDRDDRLAQLHEQLRSLALDPGSPPV